MLTIVVLDGVTHGLRRTAQTAGDAPADLGKRAAAYASQAFRSSQNVLFLLFRKLREASAALNALLVGTQEAIYHRFQIPHLPSAVPQDAPPDQAALTPAANGLCRYVKLLADLFECQHGLGDRFHRNRRGRPGQRFDEEIQIVLEFFAANPQVGIRLRAKLGNPVANVLVRILSFVLNLG